VWEESDMTRIFISYRRADSEGYVGRLYDQLVEQYDKGEIFLDVGAIRPGEDFVDAIEKAVGSCDVLLAVIGPQWLTLTDEQGQRRLDNPHDFVRLEIATALKRDILVIPVLVARAVMPAPHDLPGDLAPLSRRNAIELSHDRFAYDVERLVEAMGGAYGTLVIIGPADITSRTLGLTATMTLFPISVMLDRQRMAKITEKGSTSLKVKQGAHTLQLRSSSRMSNVLSFQIRGGQSLLFSYGTEYSTQIRGQSRLVIKQGAWEV
jgi:hypothetical protein